MTLTGLRITQCCVCIATITVIQATVTPSYKNHSNSTIRLPIREAVINVAAADRFALYINSDILTETTAWREVERTIVDLKKGDVIAVHVKDTNELHGVIVTIEFEKRSISTGVDQCWRAHRQYYTRGNEPDEDWKHPDFKDICGWRSVVISEQSDELLPPMLEGFPYKASGATYVWAAGLTGQRSIFLRYMIGGKKRGCAIPSTAWVADADLYINGRLLASTPTGYLDNNQVNYPLKEGDVVAFHVQTISNSWGKRGIIVDIHGGVNTGTWKDSDRRIEIGNGRYYNDDWMYYEYESICNWRLPSLAPQNSERIQHLVDDFPYNRQANYVWDNRSRYDSPNFLRHRVGGDGCVYPSTIHMAAMDFFSCI